MLDHALPGLTGLELVRLARKLAHRRALPVVMLTACEIEEEARLAGADAFLLKPQGIFEVCEQVARLLRTGASLHC